MPSTYTARPVHPRRRRLPFPTIDPIRVLHARRIARRHAARERPTAVETRPADSARMERAIAIYMGLTEVIAGSPAKVKQLPFSLDILTVISELPDVERWVIEDLISRCQEVQRSYLTVKQVAEAWHTSPSTILRCVRRGELRGVYSSGRLVFTPAEVDRYIRARTFSGSRRVYPDEPLVPGPLPAIERPR